jgi:hypothetical protein
MDKNEHYQGSGCTVLLSSCLDLLDQEVSQPELKELYFGIARRLHNFPSD